MSNDTQKPTRAERRNVYIRMPEVTKKKVADLASRSGMTLETYICALLDDAVEGGYTYKFQRVGSSTPS